MPGPTKIEWADVSLNFVTGGHCEVSEGCDNCYAAEFAERFRGVPGHPYEQGFDFRLWPERITLPHRWQKPRRVFVNSMSEFWQPAVPDDVILRFWKVMRDTPRHQYLILTKRPDRMERFVRRLAWREPTAEELGAGTPGEVPYLLPEAPALCTPPLPNVWLGVSVELQRHIGRVRHLARTPAAVRFVSAEPLLGPLNLRPFAPPAPLYLGELGMQPLETLAERMDWVIIGGESGPHARPMDLDWARDLVAQCREAGTAPFVKQLGAVWTRERGIPAPRAKRGGEMRWWPEDLQVRESPAGWGGRAETEPRP